MMSNQRPLGVMRPLGGGDPIPLKKTELMVGRRPTCDIRLDFENISGKHCQLRFHKGVWHVRDLNSTNGTTVNGQRISSEHGLMPDDELGVAGHYFSIDYDPVAPTSLMDANQMLEEEMAETPRHRSLMELAGLESDDGAYRRHRPGGSSSSPGPAGPSAPPPAAASRPRPARDEDENEPKPAPALDAASPQFSDDDFFNMIREDVEDEDDHGPKRRR